MKFGACNACKIAHAPCNGERPKCQRCTKQNLDCIYVPGKKRGRKKKHQVREDDDDIDESSVSESSSIPSVVIVNGVPNTNIDPQTLDKWFKESASLLRDNNRSGKDDNTSADLTPQQQQQLLLLQQQFNPSSSSSSTVGDDDGQIIQKQRRGVDTSMMMFDDDAVAGSRYSDREFLVPIKIDIEHEGRRVKDAFTWDLGGNLASPETFAMWMCEDLDLPPPFPDIIARDIKRQILNYQHVYNIIQEREIRQQTAAAAAAGGATSASSGSGSGSEDSLIKIQLSLRLNKQILEDTFEWDVNDPTNSPEQFAATLVKDLNLNTEFVPLIATAIREQILEAKQTLAEGRKAKKQRRIEDDSIVRGPREAALWEPHIVQLTRDEIEKLEAKELREARYRRRHGDTAIWGLDESSSSSTNTRSSTRLLASSSSSSNASLYVTPLYGSSSAFEGLSSIGSINISSGSSSSSSVGGGGVLGANSGSVGAGLTPANIASLANFTMPTDRSERRTGVRYPPVAPADWCVHCGLSRTKTSTMRRGPDGQRNLCNKCGLAYLTGRLKEPQYNFPYGPADPDDDAPE